MKHLVKKFVLLLIIITLSLTKTVNAEDSTEPGILYQIDKSIQQQLRCLAKNIYFEARGEPEKGKIAVAQVTINRSNDPRYPNNICDVVEQKTKDSRTNKTVCQFSWFCKPKSQLRVDLDLYYESYEIAKRVLLDGLRIEKLNNALHFHSVNINPGWNKRPIMHIGNHVFYR